MATLINGKLVSACVRESIKSEAKKLISAGIIPGLAVVIVGDDPASRTYVNNKKKACAELGFYSEEHALPAETSEAELLALVDRLNADSAIHGILVQLPLPEHICERRVLEAISPVKDVDAFHPVNVGRIMIGEYDFLPCTPAGIVELIDSTGVDITGKHCVVVGRSNIVGKPMAMLMLHRNATVTICHSKTRDLAAFTSAADILIVAVGRAGFITASMVKRGAMVIDVGMNRDKNGKLCGDVDFASVEPKVAYITPVPGGVGPMTITMLMKNTLVAAKKDAASRNISII